MRKGKLILIGMLVLIMSGRIWAKDEERESSVKYDLGKILVTATKTEIYQAETGSSSTVITEEDIKKTGKKTVQEILRDVPGITIVQNGPFGGMASIFIRGSKPGHTLVMIDGIEVNDPMSVDRSFNFANLTTDNIERIEIIRGPQSTLYGSDAMGGVINIITKKGEGKPKYDISSEGGSHNTFSEMTSVRGGTEKIDYSLSLSRLDSDGISKARDGIEKDGYENTTVSSRLGYTIFDDANVNLYLHLTDTDTDIDDGAFEDDPNYTMKDRSLASKVEFVQALKPWWDHKLSFAYTDTRRDFRDENDSVDTTEDRDIQFKGDNKKFEWQHNLPLSDWDTITAGFEYEEERGLSYDRSGTVITTIDRKNVSNKGSYLQNQVKLWDCLFITPGFRIDEHELFGTETTYRVSGSYLIKPIGTRFRTSLGTGFKAPSLFQLFSKWGDPNLNPDESKGYDFGFEQNLLNGKLSFGTTYFHNDFKNMIVFDTTTQKYKNVERAETEGIETNVSFKPIERLTITSNYTYLDTKDESTDKRLARRPENEVGFGMDWSFVEKANLNLKITYVGHNWNDSANTQKVEPYTKVDLATYYDLTRNFQIFGRIENLFDREYEEIRGFATQGRSFYTGGKVTF